MTKRILEKYPFLDIQQFVNLKDGYYTLNIRTSIYSMKKFDELYWINDQLLRTRKTKVGYGERTWFVCPLCDCNVKRLYVPHQSEDIACRKCHDFMYYKSKISGNDLAYVDRQIEEIQQLFDMTHAYSYGGLPECVNERIPIFKPRYMRWSKFYFLQNKLKRLIEKRIDIWMGSLKL